MAAFTGSLNSNIFYTALFNGFKYMGTVADSLKGLNDSLVSKFAVEGGDLGDQLVYTDMDLLTSREWDPTATNVLATEQKVVPVQQKITIDQKRQIALTVDNGYLSKRVWMDEGSWEGFKSVVHSQIGNTKKLYDQRMVDVYAGTIEAEMPSSKGSGQSQKVVIAALGESATYVETEAYQRLKAMKIGKKIADLFVDLADSTRDFNDYGFIKAFDKADLEVIWNKEYVNSLDLISLPTVFHAQGIIDFTGTQLPGRYFGRAVASTDKGSGKIINASGVYDNTKGTIRAKVEKDYTVSSVAYHCFPGDALVNGATILATGGNFTEDEVYIEDSSIICKIVHKESIKYPVSWKVNSEFFNARSLSSNHYETWYYGKPDYRRSYPVVTLRESTT